MSIELDDEVPVPRFEDNLSRELARIHEHERAEPSSLDTPGGHGRGRRSVLAGVASIAAAIGLLAAILTIGSDENDGPDLEARIVAATETALSDSIVYEVTDFAHTPGPVDMEGWRDEATLSVRTRSYGPDGEPVSDVGQTEAPSLEPPGEPQRGARPVRVVDYCHQEYYFIETNPYPHDAVDASVLVPIIDGLADGSMHVDGTEEVQGRELLRVIEGPASWGYWLVDPETYLPVLFRAGVGDGNDRAFLTSYGYLPRSSENLAQLRATDPPEGFEQVDELDRTPASSPCI